MAKAAHFLPTACSRFLAMSNEELQIVMSHVESSADLAALACVSTKASEMALDVMLRRRKLRARALANERREHRLHRAKLYAGAESDARLVATVLRHALLQAPREYTTDLEALRHGRGVQPCGVWRLRLRADSGKSSSNATDVLAMQESAMRELVYCGERLGPAGAAVAARQMCKLGLQNELKTQLGGVTFRLFLRADVVVRVLAASPSLQALVTADEQTFRELLE